MAAHPATEAAATSEVPKKGPGIVMWLLVMAVSAGGGFAVPMLLNHSTSHGDDHVETKEEEARKLSETKLVPVSYGMVTVNLNEPRLNVFLRAKVSLLVQAKNEKMVTDLVAEKFVMLQSWALSHFAEKTFEDVRGEAGQRMLQREILEKFNSMLFADGIDRILDVLFEEFYIQQ
jgi:flagellar basal body-associated protein FliL